MRWGAEQIAWWAHEAGFPDDVLALAVALAYATSRGDDAWRWVGPAWSPVDRRGLWGIDANTVPRGVGAQLYDPAHNAQVAAHLWAAEHGTFAPFPAYGAGTWRIWMAAGEAGAAHPQPPGTILAAPPPPDLAENLRALQLQQFAAVDAARTIAAVSWGLDAAIGG